MWLALGSTDMRGVKFRWYDRRERAFALAHAMRDAVRTDIDAYNDSYSRFTPSSLHTCTWLTRLRLKHSTNLKMEWMAFRHRDRKNACHALSHATIGSLHVDSGPTLNLKHT